MIHSPACSLCRDLGLLEMRQADLRTIAKCRCEAGKSMANCKWELPTIPVEGFEHRPFDAWTFRPTAEKSRKEIEEWWLNKIRISEQFWKGSAA